MGKNKVNADLGKIKLNIKSERAYNQLSQEEMSKLIGIKKSTYTLKENRPETLKLLEIIQILRVFKKSFEEIFVYKENVNEKQNGETEK